MALRLQVVMGQERLAGSPESALVGREASFVIGRDATAQWRLNDPAREISARHCEIRFDGAKYTLNDLSTNGTFLNCSSERVQGQPEITDGARIELGPFGVLVSVLTDLMQPEAQAGAPIQAKAEAAPDPAATLPRGAPRGLAVRSGDPAALLHAHPTTPSAPSSSSALDASQAAPAVLVDEVPTRITPAPKGPVVKAAAVSAPAPVVAPSAPAAKSPVPAEPEAKPAAVVKAVPVVAKPSAPAVASAVTDAGAATHALAEWVERLAQGLGVPAAALAHQDPGDLAEMLGHLVRDTASHLQQQLEAKAVDMRRLKIRPRSTRRRIDPNPLKSVSIPQALTAMLSSGHSEPESLHKVFAKSFAEVAEHHRKLGEATAMAVDKLGNELSPTTMATVFRDLVPDSATPTGKARLWDLHRTYWLELADDWPSGLREAFLQFQAEAMADTAPDAASK